MVKTGKNLHVYVLLTSYTKRFFVLAAYLHLELLVCAQCRQLLQIDDFKPLIKGDRKVALCLSLSATLVKPEKICWGLSAAKVWTVSENKEF